MEIDSKRAFQQRNADHEASHSESIVSLNFSPDAAKCGEWFLEHARKWGDTMAAASERKSDRL
jgi:hypothetical protein